MFPSNSIMNWNIQLTLVCSIFVRDNFFRTLIYNYLLILLSDDSDDLFLESVLTKHLNEDREISETELISSRLFYTLTEKQVNESVYL